MLQLGAGEVGAEATVLAGAEGDVAVRAAVDDHLVGVGEHAAGRASPPGCVSRTMSSFFIGQPWKSTSCVTFRAMLTIG